MASGENYESHEDDAVEKNPYGEHFEDNDRYKLKPNETYEAGEGHYRYETDDHGRIKKCSGTLELHEDTDRNSYAQRKAGGEDRHTGTVEGEGKDDGGHLIARRFGGSREIDNIVAQDSHLNRSEYKRMENDWESKLNEKTEDGKPKYRIDVDITCKYGEVEDETGTRASERPEKIFVRSRVTDLETGEEDKKIYRYLNQPEDNTRVRNQS